MQILIQNYHSTPQRKKVAPFCAFSAKNHRSNFLSPPHQTERCAFRAPQARNSIPPDTHFVLPEHKTVSPHHPPGAHFALHRRAFCALRAQNSAPHALPRRISRPPGAKQPSRTPASQTLPPRTAANRRRRLSRPQTRNNFDRKSPRHARGDLHFSLCACRSRPAGGKARSRAQSPLKRKGTAKPFPFVLELV